MTIDWEDLDLVKWAIIALVVGVSGGLYHGSIVIGVMVVIVVFVLLLLWGIARQQG